MKDIYLILVTAKGRVFQGESLRDAVARFEAWRDENGFGARDIGGEFPLLRGLAGISLPVIEIGRVSYNGKVSMGGES